MAYCFETSLADSYALHIIYQHFDTSQIRLLQRMPKHEGVRWWPATLETRISVLLLQMQGQRRRMDAYRGGRYVDGGVGQSGE